MSAALDRLERLVVPRARPEAIGVLRILAFGVLGIVLLFAPGHPALRGTAIALSGLAMLGIRSALFVPLGAVAAAIALVPATDVTPTRFIPLFIAGAVAFGRPGDGWSVERLLAISRGDPLPDGARESRRLGWVLAAARIGAAGGVVALGLFTDPRIVLPLIPGLLDVTAIRRAIGRWLRRRRGAVHVLFDGRCSICQRSSRVLRALDLFERLEFHDFRTLDFAAYAREHGVTLDPAHLEREMHVHRGERLRSGFHAARSLARALPGLWPLVPFLYLPGAARPGRAIYGWISRNRMTFGTHG